MDSFAHTLNPLLCLIDHMNLHFFPLQRHLTHKAPLWNTIHSTPGHNYSALITWLYMLNQFTEWHMYHQQIFKIQGSAPYPPCPLPQFRRGITLLQSCPRGIPVLWPHCAPTSKRFPPAVLYSISIWKPCISCWFVDQSRLNNNYHSPAEFVLPFYALWAVYRL